MLRRSAVLPLPLEAIRDLIGICRALYAAWKADGASAGELEHLRYIGAMLIEAYDLGADAKPYSARHNTAWTKAEEGVTALGFFIGAELPLRPSIDAAGKRITGFAPPTAEPGERRVKRG